MTIVNPGYSPPQPVVVYTQTAWSRFWSWMGWFGFFIMGLIVVGQWVVLADYFDTSGGVEEKYVSGDKTAQDKIAIITIAASSWRARASSSTRSTRSATTSTSRRSSSASIRPAARLAARDYMYHHLKKLRDDKSHSARRQHGGHRGQRRLLRLDGGRRQARHHLCRADLLDRLDRRDDSALRHQRLARAASTSRTTRSPPIPASSCSA